MDEPMAANRHRWDEMAELHISTYGTEAVDTAMQHSLRPFEVEELSPLAGKRVCHLQCHIGDDSFALARLGAAAVVGVDFSARAVEIATRRARRAGLDDRVRFVQATVEAAAGLHLDWVHEHPAVAWHLRVSCYLLTDAAVSVG